MMKTTLVTGLCLVAGLAAQQPGDRPTAPPQLRLPERPSRAKDASELARSWQVLEQAAREQRIEREVRSGNIPDRLRQLVPVQIGMTLAGRLRVLTIYVTRDVLSVGSDDDFLRVPVTAPLAYRLAEQLDCLPPTRKLSNAIWAAATTRLDPRPFSPDEHQIMSFPVMVQSHRAIQQQLTDETRDGLIAGHKKDIVITARMTGEITQVPIYGWHRLSGRRIQPLYLGHGARYVDYSHGLRLVSRHARLDGKPVDLRDLLADPELAPLASDEGPLPAGD
jgi:hypothetical protein